MSRSLAGLIALALAAASPAFGQPATAAADIGGWRVGPVPDSPGMCMARLAGDQVDVILMFNKDDKLVLTAGHHDWEQWDKQVDTTVAVDGGAPAHVSASSVGPLVMGLADDDLAARLRGAKALDWTLPKGRFHVPVTGLGAALDTIRQCQRTTATEAADAADAPVGR